MTTPSVIVLADGNDVFLNSAETYLRNAGYTIVVTIKSEEIYLLLSQILPNILILDIESENKIGWQNLVTLKRSPAAAHLPVIVCSTTSQEFQAKAQSHQMEQCVFLEKPFNFDDLLSTVRRLVRPPTTP